jgi:hypothetical protein
MHGSGEFAWLYLILSFIDPQYHKFAAAASRYR